VTLGDQVVTGADITMIGSDSKEYIVPISPAGKYVLENPPLGEVRIKVVSRKDLMERMGSAKAENAQPVPNVDKGPQLTMTTRVKVPDRYANPDNGLTIEIKAGQSVVDINLTP
jgi:hypothetical protein